MYGWPVYCCLCFCRLRRRRRRSWPKLQQLIQRHLQDSVPCSSYNLCNPNLLAAHYCLGSQTLQTISIQHGKGFQGCSVGFPNCMEKSLPFLGCYWWICSLLPNCISTRHQQGGVQALSNHLGMGYCRCMSRSIHRTNGELESNQALSRQELTTGGRLVAGRIKANFYAHENTENANYLGSILF